MLRLPMPIIVGFLLSTIQWQLGKTDICDSTFARRVGHYIWRWVCQDALKNRFLEYAALGRPGAQDMTRLSFAKMCKDTKGLTDEKLTFIDLDIIFTRAIGGDKTLTFDTFQTALKMMAKSKYGNDSDVNVQNIKDLILA
ncbi:tubulin polymerization-promoting protein-like [Amphiura filiformis]|uniref:tubulin polymerization-promoting protein-like n=1 Tax=Amphiura filiformis TaxID=82378 RepID=UPI003B20C417